MQNRRPLRCEIPVGFGTRVERERNVLREEVERMAERRDVVGRRPFQERHKAHSNTTSPLSLAEASALGIDVSTSSYY